MIFKLTKFKRDAWSGHTTYSFTTTKIGPEIDGNSALPVTGMSTKEQREMEKLMFKEPGYYSENNENFWTNYFIPFPQGGKTLNDEDPNDKLALYVLKAMKKVANGREELKLKPRAEYMLVSDAKVEQEDDDRFSVKEDAYSNLAQASPEKLRQIYSVLQKQKKNGAVVDVDSMTDKAVKNGLRTAIEASAASFNLVAEDDKLAIKAEIIHLVSKRVLSYVNNKYYYENEPIAFDLDSMVAYMEDPHRQNEVIKFKQELKGRK